MSDQSEEIKYEEQNINNMQKFFLKPFKCGCGKQYS